MPETKAGKDIVEDDAKPTSIVIGPHSDDAIHVLDTEHDTADKVTFDKDSPGTDNPIYKLPVMETVYNYKKGTELDNTHSLNNKRSTDITISLKSPVVIVHY